MMNCSPSDGHRWARLVLPDVDGYISLLDSIGYNVKRCFNLQISLLNKPHLSVKLENFLARTRDGTIKRLVILAYFKRFTHYA